MTTASVVYSDNDQLIERTHETRPDGSICRVWYSLSRGGVEQLRTEFPIPPAVSAAFPEGVMRFPDGYAVRHLLELAAQIDEWAGESLAEI